MPCHVPSPLLPILQAVPGQACATYFGRTPKKKKGSTSWPSGRRFPPQRRFPLKLKNPAGVTGLNSPGEKPSYPLGLTTTAWLPQPCLPKSLSLLLPHLPLHFKKLTGRRPGRRTAPLCPDPPLLSLSASSAPT